MARTHFGRFIVFEGGEGTGKSTQIHSLKNFLAQKGLEVVLSFEPGGTPLGAALRELLLQPSADPMSPRSEALIYSAARAEHVAKVIRPALERGAYVLCDRYWDASRAYQGVGRGLGIQAIDALNRWATDELFPDRIYLFDMDPNEGLKRAHQRQGGKLDRLEQESLTFHQKIRAAYLFLAKSDPQRYRIFDASRSIEALRQEIESDIEAFFHR